MTEKIAYCSRCLKRNAMRLVDRNFVRRSRYRCGGCNQIGTECRTCKNLTLGGKWWDDEFCAQHDGTIGSFDGLNVELKDLVDYRRIHELNELNYVSLGKSALSVATIMGTPLGTAAQFALAPKYAANGLALASLLRKANYAANSLTLAGLLRNANSHFRVRKIAEGTKHAVIVVNGFLSKGNLDTNDWLRHREKIFSDATWYHLDWDAYSYFDMPGDLLGKNIARFNETSLNAAKAGQALAQLIRQTPGWTFTLAGHSLGAAVVSHAAIALGTEAGAAVQDVYLLGGALKEEHTRWRLAASNIRGRIFNSWSSNDGVLSNLYRISKFGEIPVGLKPISHSYERIIDIDMSEIVDSHLSWKANFSEVVARATA